MSSRRAIACRASAISQGKYCSALISRVTASASSTGVVSARGAEDAATVLGQRDEATGIALLGKPLEVGEKRRALLAQALEPRLEPARLGRAPVDRIDAAVASR